MLWADVLDLFHVVAMEYKLLQLYWYHFQYK